jgi:hypothetical protein
MHLHVIKRSRILSSLWFFPSTSEAVIVIILLPLLRKGFHHDCIIFFHSPHLTHFLFLFSLFRLKSSVLNCSKCGYLVVSSKILAHLVNFYFEDRGDLSTRTGASSSCGWRMPPDVEGSWE